MLDNNISSHLIDLDYLPEEKVRELYKFKQHSSDLDFGILQNVELKALFNWERSDAIH